MIHTDGLIEQCDGKIFYFVKMNTGKSVADFNKEVIVILITLITFIFYF